MAHPGIPTSYSLQTPSVHLRSDSAQSVSLKISRPFSEHSIAVLPSQVAPGVQTQSLQAALMLEMLHLLTALVAWLGWVLGLATPAPASKTS